MIQRRVTVRLGRTKAKGKKGKERLEKDGWRDIMKRGIKEKKKKGSDVTQ